MSDTFDIPDFDRMFPGYFNADHFADGSTATVTIQTITKEALPVIGNGGKPTGETAEKWVMHFSDSGNLLVLNETNAALVALMHGRSTKGWIGKRITLHAEPNCGFGKAGVRVCGSPDIDKDVRGAIGLMPKPNRVYVLRRTDAPTEKPKPAQADPATARAKLLEAARDKHGTDEATVRAWLAEQGGTDLDAMTVDDLRGLFRALPDIAAWAAEQGDGAEEYVE
jgi:hypothetical protein